ncbi:MAG: carbohydrate-binding family 6 protein [Puniceicoccaceae bacterium]
MKAHTTLLLLLFVTAVIASAGVESQVDFAIGEIESSLEERGEKLKIKVWISKDARVKPEGYILQRTGDTVTINAQDTAGAMYGGLDLAETIRSEGIAAVADKSENPYMQMRGTKFNIPLDVRTPSYTDVCDAAQMNIIEMWNMDFWKEYIDTLAKYRYNYISLWSMHPFPSLVKVPEYPDVALDDVKRSRGPFEEYYSGRGTDWTGPEFEDDNLDTLKKMTMDEKIAFWRAVMAYGKSRNVDFYLVTWNIFDYGVGGKYGIDTDPENPTTIDYFRKSVKSLILTYPDLAGIGITTGENMHRHGIENQENRLNPEEREDWMVKTYVAGTLDALEVNPERKIRFIHRQHMTGADMVLEKMQALIDHPNVDFIFSFKYAKAHVYSATRQPFHEDFVPTIKGKVKTIWTLRNDDTYILRWGAPDFVREFVKNIPYDVSQGYYYGHDGFIMGREFTQRDHESPRQLEVNKHWMQYMLWGRFAYNPDYSNERIIAMLNARYPEVDGAKMLDAWQKASMVYPRVTGFHWGSLDFMWYIEGTRGRFGYTSSKGGVTESGFHDVYTFLNILPHKYAGVQSIKDFVAGKDTEKLTPLVLADLIDKEVEAADEILQQFPDIKDKELKLTLDDIKIICEMGRYYAEKIRGSTYFAMATASRKKSDKNQAVEAMIRAAEHYQNYVDLVTANHLNFIWFNRVGNLDFRKQISDAKLDIQYARKIEVD